MDQKKKDRVIQNHIFLEYFIQWHAPWTCQWHSPKVQSQSDSREVGCKGPEIIYAKEEKKMKKNVFWKWKQQRLEIMNILSLTLFLTIKDSDYFDVLWFILPRRPT